jgi:tRNA modification GTPase
VLKGGTDTIAAVATPPGRGGIGIVRLSGPFAPVIAQRLTGRQPEPRVVTLVPFNDREDRPIDHGLLVFFPKPRSFTGEDVVELHGHGGPVVMDMLCQRVFELGARPARPGEFSERAFLNGKLDLAQAEAIADLINSETAAAARLATRTLEGNLSRKIEDLQAQLKALRTYVEAAIDFPEEEIDFLSDSKVNTNLHTIAEQIGLLLSSARHGRLLRDGMTLVIAGLPNSGKSSLMNALAGYEAAIVTEVAGTTRDLVRERIQIEGMPVHLVDTAGVRETDDRIERVGVQRARRAAERADRVLWVFDGAADPEHGQFDPTNLPNGVPVTWVRNKIDLTQEPPGLRATPTGPEIALSATSGAGIALLREHLKHCMGLADDVQGEFIARRRHLETIKRVLTHIKAGETALEQHQAGEILAEELRLAQRTLGEITGEYSSDDLLGDIFANFCIGK